MKYENGNKIVIGVVGLIGSGKGTVGDYLVEKYNFQSLSFAKTLKDAVSSIFGWDRSLLEGNTSDGRLWREQIDAYWTRKLGREITPRRVLQEMGTEVMRNNFDQNIWLHSIEKQITESDQNVVITDVRFRNEIGMIRQLSGNVVWVRKDPLPSWFAVAKMASNGDQEAIKYINESNIHESEWAWIGSDIDITVFNNGTLTDLYEKIDQCMQIWS